MQTLWTVVLVGFGVFLSACSATPPRNRGQSGFRLDPTHDAPSELRTRALRSQDLITATNRMAQDLASRLDVVNLDNPPVIFVGEIENRTVAAHQNYQIFLARLRATLQSSGARHGLRFVRERRFIERQRDREYGGKDPNANAESYRSRADFVLTCEIFDLPSGGTNFYLLDYQLVQLRQADSGPDVGAGAIVWENSYEVKFQ